jgi:hypothetical protein
MPLNRAFQAAALPDGFLRFFRIVPEIRCGNFGF